MQTNQQIDRLANQDEMVTPKRSKVYMDRLYLGAIGLFVDYWALKMGLKWREHV